MNILELVTKNLEGNTSEIVVTVKVNKPIYLDYYVDEIDEVFKASNGVGLNLRDIAEGKDTTKIIEKDLLPKLEQAVREFNECKKEEEDFIPLDDFKAKSVDEKLNIIYEMMINVFEGNGIECPEDCGTCNLCDK